MYIGRRVKYPLSFSDFNATLVFSTDQVLFTPTHALFHTTTYQSFKLY